MLTVQVYSRGMCIFWLYAVTPGGLALSWLVSSVSREYSVIMPGSGKGLAQVEMKCLIPSFEGCQPAFAAALSGKLSLLLEKPPASPVVGRYINPPEARSTVLLSNW